MDPHFHGVIFQQSVQEIRRRLGREFPPLAILDVRRLATFIDQHIPGSVPTPRHLPDEGEVLVVGRDGADERVRAASLELLAGGRRVTELAGGFKAWMASHYPVKSGAFRATPPSVSESSVQQPNASRFLFWDVDTQVDFIDPEGKLYVAEAETLVANLATLSELADRHGIAVVASADDHQDSDAEISSDPNFSTTYPPHCMRGTSGAQRIMATQRPWTTELGHDLVSAEQLASAATHLQPQILLHKKHFDVFTNPNTEPLLKQLNPSTIVVYGVALDVCNRAAVEGLLKRGYNDLVVVTDATKPIRAEVANDLLSDWQRRGVRLATTAEVTAMWSGDEEE